MIRAAMARIATKAQVVRALANAILNWLSPSDLSLVGITFYAAPFCFSRFQSVFFSVIKQICYRIMVRTRRIEQLAPRETTDRSR